MDSDGKILEESSYDNRHDEATCPDMTVPMHPVTRSISASFVRCLNHSAVGMQGFLADVAILDSRTAFTTDARLDPTITAFIIILWNISGS